MTRWMLKALVLGSLILPASAWAGAPPDVCRAPEDAAGAIAPLPQVAATLKPGGVLRVLAVGSATMFGPDASLVPGTVLSQALGSPAPAALPAKQVDLVASERAFPRQMAVALQAAVPGLDVQVVVRGGRGMGAADMLVLLHKELEGGHFQLVLWQTGTVEAVRNSPPGEFGQTLSAGAEAIEAAGANLVLIDPQYSRFLQANSNLDPYAQALQQTASMPGVVLFRRFDLMHGWANAGQIDLERTPRADRTKAVDSLHACLGQVLARMVLASARS